MKTQSAWCVALLALAMSVTAQDTPSSATEAPGFELERVTWVGGVAAGRGVTVDNRFGDVRARFGGYEGRVEVVANVQHFAAEGPRLVVETKESRAGVEVTVGYRNEESGELITARDPDHKKRADLAIYIPLGAPLTASTDGGLFDARGLVSDVHARTVSGPMNARKVDGELHFETGSGEVLALLEGWNAERRHAFASETGGVSIYFAGEVNARIQVATSGRISTDFSMEIDYQADRRPIKRGEALVGKGSSTVEISSTEGHVRVVRRPLARKARVQPGTGR